MQKFVMFNTIPEDYTIFYADGSAHTNAETKARYPILTTPLGVIGITTDENGTIENPVFMGYYDNYNSFRKTYADQGCELTDTMTKDEVCAAITEFVNTPQLSLEDEAIADYLAL